MAHQYILTLDLGTSSAKTALWTDAGALAAETSQSYALHRPNALYAEMDAQVWWDAVCATTRAVLAQSGVAPQDVAGIGVDGIGWTLVAVDQAINPLYPALIWLDRRAEPEARWLASLPEANAWIDLAANPLDPAYITPKLVWLQRHHPEIFDATRQFLTASGFLVARLTGECVCDYTQAYGYHFFDLRREKWDEKIARRLAMPPEKFPRLASCTEIAGTLTTRAAHETGLCAGIPVIVGCLDAAAGALGAGVTRVGQTNEQGGQAGGMAISLDHVVVEPRLIFSHHVLPKQYLLQGGTVGGGALGWFRDTFGPSESDAASKSGTRAFESFSAQAEKTAPGANGVIFIPYMAGERTPLWNSNARGVFLGLSYATTRGDLVRAIMEGCAFAVYHNVRVAAQHGIGIGEYLGSGGATASAVWCQIKADVYGKPFVVARRADGGEGGHSLGLYALTARALEWCDDAGACVQNLLPQRRVYEPNAQTHARYQELFDIYLSVSQKLLPDFDALARAAGEKNL
jgi:xylulokinase